MPSSRRYQMAKQGTSFTEGDLSFTWGEGENGVRDVIEIPDSRLYGRLARRIASGFIVETSDPVTVAPEPAPQGQGGFVRLSAPASDGDGLTFNAETGLFDPVPRAANIGSIDLPENATPADVAEAFNDLRVVLIEANIMEPDPT